MSAFDRIIGYKIIKKELERTADALKNTEVYRALGVSTPRGLLLHGEPGVGKSLMASCLIEESGRNVLTLRRDKPDGDFVRAIKDILPNSLIRAGRFDRVIEVECPDKNDAPEIIAHFLADKPLAKDVDAKTVARLLSGCSCAELETATNAAGMLAAYERCPSIMMRHIIMGCISVTHGITADHILTNRTDNLHDANSTIARVACHEAGHAVVAETLEPGSVTLACVHEPQGRSRGIVMYAASNDSSAEKHLNSIIRAVAGYTAAEFFLGIADMGASEDIRKAKDEIFGLISDNRYCGSYLLDSVCRDSNELRARQELAVSMELDRSIVRAKKILIENRSFFEAVIVNLLQKGLLTGEDIQEIKRNSMRTCT